MRLIAPQQLVASWQWLAVAHKLTVLLTLIAIAGLLCGGVALTWTISPAFERLETDAVERRQGIADRYLHSLLASVEGTASDYGVWDDSYEYILTNNPDFVEESLTGLVNVGINGVAYVTFGATLLHAHYIDLETGENIPEFRQVLIATAQEAGTFQQVNAHRRSSYFAMIGDQLLAIGVAQVVKSDGTGTPEGFVLMAREVSDEEASEALQMDVRFGPALKSGEAHAVRGERAWSVAVPVLGLADREIAALRFEVTRDISQLGRQALFAAFLAGSVIVTAMLLVIGAIIRRVVASRLAAIERHMQMVADTGDLVPLPTDPNRDELGSLRVSFNKMIAQLKDLREQVEIQSYKLGRGEWAAGVLHNVRNALNPVTVIMSKVAAQRSAARSQDIDQAAQELADPNCDPPRRQALLAFMVKAFEEAERNGATRRKDLLAARSLLSEAIRILSDQYKVAHEDIPQDRIELREIVEHNAALVRFAPWGEVSVHIDGAPTYVFANRLLLSQVIGNLMTNAVEAIAACNRRPGTIDVAVKIHESAGAQKVDLTIKDNGIGFEPIESEKLFAHGKSSKKSGSGGLGLHWCANTVSAMGGKLTLTSAGSGMGACAVLTLNADRQLPASARLAHLAA